MCARSDAEVRSLEILFNVGTSCGLSDVELLERFLASDHDIAELSFEGLVVRHGPMVLDVCRKILGDDHDAQDAFQATFLILATRARSILKQKSVGSWLHGVALRVARRARSDAERRKFQERRIAEMTKRTVEAESLPGQDDFQVLHEEVERLPRKYREPIVLCYLEGVTLETAADQLRCPIGTIGVRLMRARERLKSRLSRRGVSPRADLLITGRSSPGASAILPDALIRSTVAAATRVTSGGSVSLAAVKLTHEVLRSMVVTSFTKIGAALTLVIGVGSLGGGFLVHSRILAEKGPTSERIEQGTPFRIGQKVTTKYGDKALDADGVLRIYSVDRIDGGRVRITSEGMSFWIDPSQIVLLDEAIEFYSREIRSNPNNAAAYHHRALVLSSWKGDFEKAIDDYTEAIRLEPRHGPTYHNRGQTWAKLEDYHSAIADYDEAIQLGQKSGPAYLHRALAWEQIGDHHDAIADFTEAIRLGSGNALAYNHRGMAREATGEFDKAIADYHEAIRLDPTTNPAFLNRAIARKAEPFDKDIADLTKYIRFGLDPASTYNLRGWKWGLKGDYDKAIADYNEAIRLDPKDALIYVNRGKAWYEKKQYDRAIADFSEAIQLDSELEHAYVSRGFARDQKQDWDKAISDFSEAIRLNPENNYTYCCRGRFWRKKGEVVRAIADFDEAIRLKPQYATAYVERGETRRDMKELNRAITDFDEAIRLEPQDAFNYVERGMTRRDMKEFDRAIADFDEAIRIDPRGIVAYAYRGKARYSKGDFDEAIADFNEAIRLDPEAVRLDRGWAWFCKRQYGKAIADFNEAIRLTPEIPDGYGARAWVWATCPDEQYRDGKKAVASATKACELTDWKEPSHLDTLAAAYAEAGEFDSAVKWQSKANELFQDAEAKKDGETRLNLYREKKPYYNAEPAKSQILVGSL